ncbi:hypothetical protein O9456_20930, partial [Proteus mirabilis]|nr:hypothetical protein [Proteus mirabilis]
MECGCPFGSNVVIASTTHTSARFANVTITPEESFYKNNISQENKSYATPIIDIAEHKYTVTIYTAYPGTPMSDDNGSPRFEGGNSSIRKTSSAGHMWLQIKEFNKYNKIIGDHSYGFAPINTGIKGDGIVTKTDTIHYENPYYNRTIEITKQQYNKIYEFGQMAVNKSETYFNLYYHGITNSCIDFTWKTLRHAGITPNVNLYDSAQLSNINGNIKIFEKQQGKFDGDLKVID